MGSKLPLVRNRNPNLRVFYTGDGNVFFHNVDMRERELGTGDGHFAYDYTVERNFRTGEPLRVGDVVEFEFGVFLSTEIEGRTNYYTDTYRYVVGTPGLVPLTEPGVWWLAARLVTDRWARLTLDAGEDAEIWLDGEPVSGETTVPAGACFVMARVVTSEGGQAAALSAEGTQLWGEVRGKRLPVTVAPMPFRPSTYKR